MRGQAGHARPGAGTDGALFTVAASAVASLLRFTSARGGKADALLEAVGLNQAALEDPKSRVLQSAYNQLWELLATSSDDRDLGLHFAEQLDLDAFDVVGHIAARSPTLGEAFAQVARYARILHDAGRVEIEPRGDKVAIYPGCRGLPHGVPRHVAEFAAASLVVLGRRATATQWMVEEVRFRHGRPPSVQEHRRLFGVTPAFDAAENMIVVPNDVLALPLAGHAERALLPYLDAHARERLAALPADEETLSARVREIVARELEHGPPPAARVGRQLAIHPRTLHRRLREEGTSFLHLVEEVRRTLAEGYLRDQRLSLGEIAFLLGYGELSNFYRAFRRWTGSTPKAFRTQAQRPPAGQTG